MVGLETCYGLLYANMLTDTNLLGADRGTLAWVGSIAIFLELALGILIGRWIDKYGARMVCVIGGLLMSSGLILSSLVTRVEELFITYSIIVGIGMAMAYGASSIAVGQYFTTKAPFANATAGIGTGVGTIILAYIIQLLLVTNGWRSCMQLLSIISLVTIGLCGLAYIPLSSSLLASIAANAPTMNNTDTSSTVTNNGEGNTIMTSTSTANNNDGNIINNTSIPSNDDKQQQQQHNPVEIKNTDESVSPSVISKTEPLTGLSLLQKQPNNSSSSTVGTSVSSAKQLQIRSPIVPNIHEDTRIHNETIIVSNDPYHHHSHDMDDDYDSSLPSTPLTGISTTNTSSNTGIVPRGSVLPQTIPDSASNLSLANMIPPSPVMHPSRTLTNNNTSPSHSVSAYPIIMHGMSLTPNTASPAISSSLSSAVPVPLGIMERSTSNSSSLGIPLHRTTSSQRYHYDQNVSPFYTPNGIGPTGVNVTNSPMFLSTTANHEELIKVINNTTRNTPLSPFLMPGAHSSAASIVPHVSLKAPALAALLRESNQRRPRSLTSNSSFSLGNSHLNPGANNNPSSSSSSLYYLQNQGGRFHHQPLQQSNSNSTSSPNMNGNTTDTMDNSTAVGTVPRSVVVVSSSLPSSSSTPFVNNRSTSTGGSTDPEVNVPSSASGTTVPYTSGTVNNQPYEPQGYINTQTEKSIVSMTSLRSDASENSLRTVTNTTRNTKHKETDDNPISVPFEEGSPVLDDDNEQFVQALELALNDKTVVTTPPVTWFGKLLHIIKLLPAFRMQRTSALYVWSDSRFWAIAIAMALVVSSITIPETHLGAYAEDVGMDSVFIGNLYSIMGLAGIIGRIIFGLVTLRYDIDLLLLMQFCGITTGLSIFGLAIYGHFESYLVLNSVIIGGLGGAIFGFVSPILANLFGIPGLPYALGGTYTIRAPIVLVAAPIAGWLRSEIGSYTHIWTVTGLCLILSALPIALMSTKCRRIR